jgi:hypothetical protein
MVAGKVKAVMGFQRSSPSTPKLSTPKASTPKAETPRRSSVSPANSTAGKSAGGTSSFVRSFGVYFPKSNAQVQPRPPDVADLLKVIEDLQERESRLRTELIEQKIMRETVAIVPFLEAELDRSKESVKRLEMENLVLREEVELLRSKEERYREMQKEIECLKNKIEAQRRDQDECSSSSSSSVSLRNFQEKQVGEIISVSPRIAIPKPPPLPSYSFPKSYRHSRSSSSSSPSTSSSSSSVSNSASEMSSVSTKQVPKLATLPPIPPPPPATKEPLSGNRSDSGGHPPPPPPPPPRREAKGGAKGVVGPCVRRVPEVVEFYHSLMRRESKRECGGGTGGSEATTAAVCPRDMIGEIENRSAHLLAVSLPLYLFENYASIYF